MKKLIILLLFGVLCSNVFGQEKSAKVIVSDTLPNNCFYFEFGGSSLFFGSINYERIIFHEDYFYLSGRIGFGVGYMPGLYSLLSSPIIVSGIFHVYKRLYGEIGFGTTLIHNESQNQITGKYQSCFWGTIAGVAGLRLKSPKGFVFRATFSPLYSINNDLAPDQNFKFIPWFGVSLGGCFGK